MHDACDMMKIIERLVDMLRTMNIWIQEIPPLKQPSRFGNKAYRIWNERLCEVCKWVLTKSQRAPQLIETAIRKENPMLCTELAGYLEESFGNPTRIDYGTGHETTFIIFLCTKTSSMLIQSASTRLA